MTWLETLFVIPTCNKLFESEKARRVRENLPQWSMSALTKAAKDAKSTGTTVLGYEATFFDFIAKMYPSQFSGIGEFQSAKLACSRLADHNSGANLTDLKAWAQQSVAWTDRRVKNATFVMALADSIRLFDKYAPDLLDHTHQMARFAAVSTGEDMVPFLIQAKSDVKLLERAFHVVSDDKKCQRLPGFNQTTTPADGGTPRPTLLLDEVIRTMSMCCISLDDTRID